MIPCVGHHKLNHTNFIIFESSSCPHWINSHEFQCGAYGCFDGSVRWTLGKGSDFGTAAFLQQRYKYFFFHLICGKEAPKEELTHFFERDVGSQLKWFCQQSLSRERERWSPVFWRAGSKVRSKYIALCNTWLHALVFCSSLRGERKESHFFFVMVRVSFYSLAFKSEL